MAEVTAKESHPTMLTAVYAVATPDQEGGATMMAVCCHPYDRLGAFLLALCPTVLANHYPIPFDVLLVLRFVMELVFFRHDPARANEVTAASFSALPLIVSTTECAIAIPPLLLFDCLVVPHAESKIIKLLLLTPSLAGIGLVTNIIAALGWAVHSGAAADPTKIESWLSFS